MTPTDPGMGMKFPVIVLWVEENLKSGQEQIYLSSIYLRCEHKIQFNSFRGKDELELGPTGNEKWEYEMVSREIWSKRGGGGSGESFE